MINSTPREQGLIDTHFIFKLLELHSIVVAYLLIIDHKMDGKYDLVLVDEDYIKDVKKGLKWIFKRIIRARATMA